MKFKLNQILLVVFILIVSLWLVKLGKEKYKESQLGPTVREVAEDKKMTQAELDAVLKFIR